MDEKTQIEEMAKVLCPKVLTEYCASGICTNPNCLVNAKALETLYNAGYRKQSEWISIAERLPEKSGRYLVYGSFAGMPLVCGAHYDRYNGFGDDGFTHWMPLPEPPKGI